MAPAAQEPDQPALAAFGPGLEQIGVDGGAKPFPGQRLQGGGQGVKHRLPVEQVEGQVSTAE